MKYDNTLTSNYVEFLYAVYNSDLSGAKNIANTFKSKCSGDGSDYCAYAEIIDRNKRYKTLQSQDLIDKKFNNKITLYESQRV
tara:strand:- start:5807 stop:6055 length:249 start_codon:yes stop_codon:yes gene_type:complete